MQKWSRNRRNGNGGECNRSRDKMTSSRNIKMGKTTVWRMRRKSKERRDERIKLTAKMTND